MNFAVFISLLRFHHLFYKKLMYIFLVMQILNGPITNLRLKAFVTMPEIRLSTDVVEFNDVICGKCKVVTVQLDNITKVR